MYELYEARIWLKDNASVVRNFESVALTLPWIADMILKLEKAGLVVTGVGVNKEELGCCYE